MKKKTESRKDHDRLAHVDQRISELTMETAEKLQCLINFMMLKRDLRMKLARDAIKDAFTPKLQKMLRESEKKNAKKKEHTHGIERPKTKRQRH